MKYRQGKRRRMTKFRIDELSPVDHPAQAPAQALFLKRVHEDDVDGDEDDEDEKDKDRGGLFGKNEKTIVVVTTSEHGHTHAVWLYGETTGGETGYGFDDGEATSHAHPWSMNGLGEIEIGENAGHTHTVDRQTLSNAVLATMKRLAKSGEDMTLSSELQKLTSESGSNKENPMPEPQTDPKAMEKLQAELDRTKKVAELNDAQTAHFGKLDVAGQDAYLAKSAPDRQAVIDAEIEKAAADDSVVYTDLEGNTFSKSDDARLVASAKRADEAITKAAKLETQAQNAAFAKRASVDIPHLPGEDSVGAAIIKALDGISDEGVRKSAFEAVRAGSKAVEAAFEKRGALVGDKTPSADANTELEKRAKDMVKAATEPISYLDAYQKAADADPELYNRAIAG